MADNSTKANSGALAGVRIVDMSSFVFGPYATLILSELGAEVIKVETGAGDYMRHEGRSPSEHDMGPAFMHLNRNKKCVHLDVQKTLPKEALRRLLGSADAFVHNVRMAGMERLGFGYEAVRALREDIVYVHCAGYGADGPYGGKQAYDDLIQAASGLTALLPLRDGGDPAFLPSLLADKVSGLHAAYATLAALFHRQRSGEGQFVEVPMLESVTHMNMVEHLYGETFLPPTYGMPYRRSVHPSRKPVKTKDGFIVVLPQSDRHWQAFLRASGREDLLPDQRFATVRQRSANAKDYYPLVAEILAQHSTDHWMRVLGEAQVPAMRCNSMEEVLRDEHLRAVGMFDEKHSEHVGRYRSIRHPVNFTATPAVETSQPAPLGHHTREIMAELGFAPAEVDEISGQL